MRTLALRTGKAFKCDSMRGMRVSKALRGMIRVLRRGESERTGLAGSVYRPTKSFLSDDFCIGGAKNQQRSASQDIASMFRLN